MSKRPFRPGARRLAIVTALCGWAVLALQLSLLVDEMGMGEGLWRYLSFFTLLTNIGVAVVASAMAMGKGGWLAGPRARLVMAVAIAFVGIVYWIALAPLYDPQGWALVADIGLHTTQPLLFVATWYAAREGSLTTRDAAAAMGWPIAYAAYGLARGAVDGWYPYWFLDPSQQGWGGTAASIALLSVAFFVLASVFVWLDRRAA
ncbi:Pr6Pr family membrane protein [Sphingomicrobium clamense]|uniref:Pr6Pr family membrane protein n=1 Tax=Sphingomicrobium clamense TaxID=2851013 RepID=A0ABS6V500_9SPHN|nr:Pr6Pr family membrane protein [Sphingomicrobium sp. B8]MBW0144631.1 Pr6Pr family membrane protein [Sphingomicrobium sp. B8]